MSAASKAGGSFLDVLLSGVVGFVSGAISTAGGIYGGPVGAMLGGAVGSGLNNVGNQLIFTGKVEWGSLAASLTSGFMTGALSYGAYSAANGLFFETAANYITFPMGLAIGQGYGDTSGVPVHVTDQCSYTNTLCYELDPGNL